MGQLLIIIYILLSFIPTAYASASCSPILLVGKVTYVRDGDTIEVAGVPIRLNGLAAPENNEPGGLAATIAMRRLVDGKELRCELTGEHTYDRCVGICYLDGKDISANLVQQGVARDCPRYSWGRYAETERRAAADGAKIRRTYPLPDYCLLSQRQNP